jgi:signal transduction histidine kinase
LIARSLRLRLIVAASVLSAVAIALAGLLIANLLRQFVESQYDAAMTATMVSVMAASEVTETGALAVAQVPVDPRYDQPLSGWYWQIADPQNVLLRSRSLWDGNLGEGAAEPTGDIRMAAARGPDGEALRIMSRDFTTPGGTEPYRVSVAMPAGEISNELGEILYPLALSLGLLIVAIGAAIAVQVTVGLRPLAVMRERVGEIRRGERLALPEDGPREIAPLAAEVNALIDQNRAIMERARTHVGNLAHALKTPLSVLANEAARTGDPTVTETVATMDRLIRHHLRRARAAAGSAAHARADLGEVISDLLAAMRGIYAERRLAITSRVDANAVFGGERQDADEMLGNLIDNACKWAGSAVSVTARRDGGWIVVEVADDGPGMEDAESGLALRRGARLDEGKPGSGLGLAIVVDLAALYGGALELSRAPQGGLLATLTLPAAP